MSRRRWTRSCRTWPNCTAPAVLPCSCRTWANPKPPRPRTRYDAGSHVSQRSSGAGEGKNKWYFDGWNCPQGLLAEAICWTSSKTFFVFVCHLHSKMFKHRAKHWNFTLMPFPPKYSTILSETGHFSPFLLLNLMLPSFQQNDVRVKFEFKGEKRWGFEQVHHFNVVSGDL